MNKEELMINDWVRFPNSIEKVQEVAYVEGKGYCASFAASATLFPIPIDKIEPIPLTPEILERNGFVKEEEERGFSEPYCVYVCDDFQYVIKVYPKGLMDRYSRLYIGEDDDNENASLLINYLHELQHALKLCGIDKEIVP